MLIRWRAGVVLKRVVLKRAALIGVTTVLGGCAVGPNYAAPPGVALAVPAQYTLHPAPGAPVDLATWWTRFNDPLLTDLIARATAANLDIAVSEARLRQARESLLQAHAALGPTVTASASETHTAQYARSSVLGGIPQPGGSQAYDGLSGGLAASWQADLFGGNRRSVEAARASTASAVFGLIAVRTSVAGEVATNYIDARLAQARLAIARDTLRTQDDNLEIATWRLQAGLASSLDQEQARAQRAQTAATIPPFETAFTSAVNRIGVLTGQAPGALRAELDVPQPIPVGPEGVAVGIPADTLRQRPDVRGAERDLATATAQIGVAQAQLYPALTLTGNLTSQGSHFTGLADLVTGTLFAGLAQTIFDGGRLRSQVRAARANADAAFATYKHTVLSGLEDVENGIQALESAKRAQAALGVARDASNNAAILARSQYRSGLTDFVTLTQSEQTLLSARDQLAAAQAAQASALVQLYLALGGGWQPETAFHNGKPL
jgi:NodT family efflux transporter outer membrane factor (OMF) lipoprotein